MHLVHQQDSAMSERFDDARAILRQAVADRATPAAVVEVGDPAQVIWREAFGALTYEADAPAATPETIFDLASLTKVLSTTSLAMAAVETGRLGLDDPVARWIPEWRGADRDAVTVADLLEHASGLTAYLPFFNDPHMRGRAEYQRAIATLPLEYAPRSQSIYSDLGFILLGFILEDAGGAPLARQFERVATLVAPDPLAFNPPDAWRARTAPTEIDRWRGRLVVGEVHDENGHALGGAAGHAGLFGTAAAVGRFARLVLATTARDTALARRATLERFRRPSAVPGSSRALGWDTMRPTSSCGALMPPDAIGHTGFTGTSLWIAPSRDLYVVLLANRVHPARRNEQFREVRPRVHDAILNAY